MHDMTQHNSTVTVTVDRWYSNILTTLLDEYYISCKQLLE